MIVSTNHLTKVYNTTKAVDQVSIHVRRGDIYGLIGLNGAGKTTLLKAIAGLIKPTDGEVNYFGDLPAENEQARRRISCLIERPGIFPNFTAQENLKLRGLSLGLQGDSYIGELLDLVGLEDVGKKKTKAFSLGMKQRLGIALALVGSPDLVLLDEPINGLDPQGIVEVRHMIENLRDRGISFIISSHILGELSKFCTTYGFIHRGQLLEEISHDELIARCRERVVLETSDTGAAIAVLDEGGIQSYKVTSNTTIEIYEGLEETVNLNRSLVAANIPVNRLGIEVTSLEDYFLNLTGGQNA